MKCIAPLRAFLLLLAACVPAGPMAGQRQPRERDHANRGRVILYDAANFQGPAIVLYPGDRLPDFGRQFFDDGTTANDRVSSIMIDGDVELSLFVDAQYQGDALVTRDSISNLANHPGPSRRGNWNDIASSATVTAVRDRRARWAEGTGRGEVRGPRVELYSESDYRGSRIVLSPGDKIQNLARAGFEDDTPANDRISSIRISGGAVVNVYEHANFQGGHLLIDESQPNLGLTMLGPNRRNWNDAISSVAVTTRQAATQAERIITEAFRDLLGRQPDAHNLAHYREAMQNRGLTEAELRSEIRRSLEFRHREAELAVLRAYREVLKREADPDGLATYKRLMVDQNWTEARVREALRASDEYRQRQKNG
jgi:hypothetical protein